MRRTNFKNRSGRLLGLIPEGIASDLVDDLSLSRREPCILVCTPGSLDVLRALHFVECHRGILQRTRMEALGSDIEELLRVAVAPVVSEVGEDSSVLLAGSPEFTVQVVGMEGLLDPGEDSQHHIIFVKPLGHRPHILVLGPTPSGTRPQRRLLGERRFGRLLAFLLHRSLLLC
jgi:hypothetical protein